ncbi:spore maturation protein SpmA [Chitinophaga skermanii]|uniref:Spore maturation protein SpmA n=1 Tax=Chitinophaga skermanii TaxID=331697 RepID=A0A327QRJ5_9BACT|nr:nucleoside recognition domain-containing protein [Chitinophaga skermanii]RAJ06960.1 spore maturation protein SpmA [Chitinophaga skermanii]
MALNFVWLAFFIIAFLVGLYKMIFLNDIDVFSKVMNGMFDSAKTGAEISIGLVGIMTFWLGIMRVGEKAGMINRMARLLNPFFTKLFPGVPKNDPALGSVFMNFSANALGLDNAATPIGLKAMKQLQDLNPTPETATNAQIMFLVLNTAGLSIIPTSVIAMRLAQGSANPAEIFIPTLIGTFISFMSGLIAVAFFQRINLFKPSILAFVGIIAGFMALMLFAIKDLPPDRMAAVTGAIGGTMIIGIIIAFLVAGMLSKINVYEVFIDGAKEGFTTSVMIIPYLVAILVAISAFRVTGCLDFIINGIGSFFAMLGVNTDFVPALPVGFMKSLSGGGARGFMVDIFADPRYGPDSFVGRLASIMNGSTETTFYVLAVYFGSVGIKNTRHALVCGLIADLIGIIAAIIIAYIFYH